MKRMVPALLGLALFLFGNMSWAQDNPPSTPEEKEEDRAWAWSYFMFEEVLLRSCDDPTLRTALALPQPKLILETTNKGETRVKAHVGLELQKQFLLNLEVESPRGQSEETTLASLDGLSDGSTAEIKFSWVGWRPQKIHDDMLEIIRRPTKAQETQETSPKDAVEKLVRDDTATEWRMADYLKPTLSRPSAIAMLGPKKYKEAVAAYPKWMREKHYSRIPVLTAKLNAEQNKFKFFIPAAGPPAGLKETSESHTDYQFTASAGSYLWGRVYSALNYRRGTKFVDGRKEEFCSPAGPAHILDCTTLPVTPPKKGKPEALELEARGLFGNFGLAAYLTRNLQANVTAVEIPLYFLQKMGSSEMELNGGVAIKWQSDTNDFSISVFIGPALSTVFRRNR